MKKFYLKLAVYIVLTIAILTLYSSCYAITPSFTYKCSGGVSGYYYINEGTSNVFYSLITAAAHNWEYTGYGDNPVYLTIKSNNDNTIIDIYNEYGTYWDNPSILGETIHRDGSANRVDPYLNNWDYSEIHLNETYMSSNKITNSHAQGTIAHEMGHAFGLAHYNNNPTGSIMCQSFVPRIVQTVQQEDNEAINPKY